MQQKILGQKIIFFDGMKQGIFTLVIRHHRNVTGAQTS